MVRKYVRKDGGRTWHLNANHQHLEKAVNEIKREKSSYIVASQRWGKDMMEIFQAPKKTHQHPVGRLPIITSAEEEMFKKHLCMAAEWGFPLDLVDIRVIVKCYLDRCGVNVICFKNNYPGVERATNFLRRQCAAGDIFSNFNCVPKLG